MIYRKYLIIVIVLILILLGICFTKYNNDFNPQKIFSKLLTDTKLQTNMTTSVLPVDRVRCGQNTTIWNSGLPEPLKCQCGTYVYNNGGTSPVRNFADRGLCNTIPRITLNYAYNNSIIHPGRIITNETLYSNDGKIVFKNKYGFFGTYLGEDKGILSGMILAPNIYSFETSGNKILMTYEGDLQIYDNNNNKVWSIKDNAKVSIVPNSYAEIHNDGRIKVRDQNNNIIWQSFRSILVPGAAMEMGESLVLLSSYGLNTKFYYRYSFNYKYDGTKNINNIVVTGYTRNTYDVNDPYNPYKWITNLPNIKLEWIDGDYDFNFNTKDALLRMTDTNLCIYQKYINDPKVCLRTLPQGCYLTIGDSTGFIRDTTLMIKNINDPLYKIAP